MVDYKTIVSTTDSKVTLMQWLQALAKEFDNAKITDIAFANDGNSSLTFTFTLTDGTTKTATCKAITLTDDEKAIISGLVGQVATSADGITFNKAVTFAGNIVTKGNEIHQGYESHLGDESHSGTATYKGVIKTSEIDNTSGNAMLRNKDTEGAIVLGSSAKKAVIMGSGDRPTYSKNGSDFAGSELALKSDIETISDYLIVCQQSDFSYKFNPDKLTEAWDDHTPRVKLAGHNLTIYDDGVVTSFAHAFEMNPFGHLSSLYFTGGRNASSFESAFNAIYNYSDRSHPYDISVDIDASSCTSLNKAFANLYIEKFKSFAIKNINQDMPMMEMFKGCYYLKVIPAFDISHATSAWNFTNTAEVEEFLPYGMRVSLNLSSSTKYTQSALRVVIDNLADMSSATTKPTLTLGSTNLAKLTADDITTANNKGWNLA